MASNDYYEILGVKKSATPDEIKKAYRKLARENHPDVKKDDPVAAERFKAVQEAYDVVGDPDRRKKYDQFGPNFAQYTQAGAGGGAAPGGGPFGGGFGGRGGQVDFDLGDLFGGADLGDLFGGGRRGRSQRPAPGRDLEAAVRVPFEVAARGGTVDLQLDSGTGPQTLSVKIPAGVHHGSVIRLAGQGSPSRNGGPAGNLLLTVEIEPHRIFHRDGFNLSVDVPLTPAEAALGAKVDVPTLSEGTVVMTVPPGTSSGAKLRLRGKGIVNPQTQEMGDQFAVMKIVVPKQLTDQQRALYQQLLQLDQSPR